jgi:hypothetical protein
LRQQVRFCSCTDEQKRKLLMNCMP